MMAGQLAGPSPALRPGEEGLRASAGPPPRVAVIGAFDRFNYGDLLFAVVAERMIRATAAAVPIGFYSTVRSDWRRLGGHRTLSLRDLLRPGELPHSSVAIVAGGEVLNGRWGHTMETVVSAPLAFCLRRVDWRWHARADALARWLSGTRLELPWVLGPEDFPGWVRVAYNSVGGSSLDQLPPDARARVEEKLGRAAYLSVRDERTRSLLEAGRLAGRARLAPDSAVLISAFYPAADLERRAAPAVREIVGRHPGGYLCFQINKALGSGQARLLAEQLEAVHRRYGLAAVLLPNGRARNHEDQVALAAAHRLLRTPAVLARGALTIYDIMYLIASARAYAGTSLHGSITALTYEVPQLGLTRSVPKLEAFLRTWGLPGPGCVPLQELSERLAEALAVPRAALGRKRAELVAAAQANFRELFAATGIAAAPARPRADDGKERGR
jgi:hypothetical protein